MASSGPSIDDVDLARRSPRLYVILWLAEGENPGSITTGVEERVVDRSASS